MQQPAIPILMYHQITPQRSAIFGKYEVTPAAFATQIKWLNRAGYTTVSLDNLLDYYKGQGRLPAKPIIITFDDGFRDCVQYTVPVLERYGFSAVYYLVANLVGETSRWLALEGKPEFAMADWEVARQLVAKGFEIGSHSLSHPHLAEISEQQCYEELSQSRQILAAQLGQEIKHLAYPFGSYNSSVQKLANEAGYSTACSVRIGFSRPNDDLLALHRVPVLGQDKLSDFICRLYTARPCAEVWRHSLSRVKQRLPLRKRSNNL